MGVGRRDGESGEDEGLGSETRLDRPRSAKGHRRRVETVERKGEEGADIQSEEHLPETHPSQQSPSPPPTITHPPAPAPMGLV